MTVRPSNRSVADVRSTLVSAAGSGGLRVRLVRAADDAKEPFVLVHAGRFARILLAELVGDDDQAIVRFAWKLRVDEVAASAIESRTLPNNGELDAQWRQERAELLRVHSPHVVAPVAVPSALTRSPPVWHCRRVDRYFHPPCPQTGRTLRVCRDDALLQAAGLGDYEHASVRYLHHGDASGPRTFYSVRGGDAPSGDARVASRQDLVRGWRDVAHGDGETELPCRSCEHRATCFPHDAAADAAVPAEQYLHAVSFYDVDSIALELAAVDFESAVERLGGGESAGIEGRRAWMGGPDVRPRALEVLRLKLAAFADICRGVADVHQSGRPHLGVSPANIVAFDDAASSALPCNWLLRLALTDLGGARPVRVPGAAGETLWQPGREVSEDETSRLFLSPSLRSLEGGTVTMSVALRRLPDEAGGERVVVDVHRAGVPPFVLPGDLLILLPNGDEDPVCARVEDVSARGLQATVLPEQVAAIAAHVDATVDARLSFVRRSGPSADLYGLGMVLLHLLLVHDEQSLPEVAACVETCLTRMASMAAQAAGDGGGLADCWQQILDGDDGEGRFATWSLMHRRADRQRIFEAELKGQEVVPKALWHQLLGLAGRLLLASPIARADGDGAVAMPLHGVLNELERIERRLHVELFDQVGRDEAILQACSQRGVQLRAELASETQPLTTMAKDGPLGASERKGFVLAVGRIGESSIEQHHFVENRVTIGRREEDNHLLLADPMVSSKHAVIERSDGEYVLFDRGSTNGTEVDGIRLPVEVPHPLDDGSVIHIRPFVLSFRRAESSVGDTTVTPVIKVEALREQLRAAYAEAAHLGAHDVHVAFHGVFDKLRDSVGRKALLVLLEECHQSLCGEQPKEPERDDALARSALRAVRQLARNLVGSGRVESEQQLQEFANRLQRFVEVTTRWIEDTLEWRRVLGQQLDLRATGTGTGGGRAPLRSAAEVRAEVLEPRGEDAQATDYFLARFFDDVLSILAGLLQGNQQVRRAVRERLDPLKLIEAAGRESKLRILVQATANSALWKVFTDTFAEVTAGSEEHDAELQRLLAKAEERRRDKA